MLLWPNCQLLNHGVSVQASTFLFQNMKSWPNPLSMVSISGCNGSNIFLALVIKAMSPSVQFSSVAQSCPNLCDPTNLSTPQPPCPSLTPRVCSNSCPLSRWCHQTTSSSVAPYSSSLQSFPATESFQMSQLITSGGQSIGASATGSSFQWIFRVDFL